MRVFRIAKPEHVHSALHGQGAALAPGRWNSRGVRVGYAATSVSLAMLEVLVHMSRENVPQGLRILTFEVPDDAIQVLPEDQWPIGWDALAYSETVRSVGDAFVAGLGSLALLVPSAIARGEKNVLINPAHPRFGEIARVANEPLAMDPRLFD